MSRPVPTRGPLALRNACLGAALVVYLVALGSSAATAQIHGVPPSVTSIQFHVAPFLPNARPSVTSMGPYPVYNHSSHPPPYGVQHRPCARGCRHRASYGYNTGGYYAPIYAVPMYDYSDPYLYSGPPADQPEHVVADLAPDHAPAPEYAERAPAYAMPPQPAAEPLPIDSTVLVFRDGHQQEVSNYAIMGQTVYVFDYRTQKIGLGDLDLPATIKLNDDRGVEFQLPGANHS